MSEFRVPEKTCGDDKVVNGKHEKLLAGCVEENQIVVNLKTIHW